MASTFVGSFRHANKDDSLHNLSSMQIYKEIKLLQTKWKFYPLKKNFSTLIISPLRIINVVQNYLDKKGLQVNEVLLKTSGTSFCLVEEGEPYPPPSYNNVDIALDVKLQNKLDHCIIWSEGPMFPSQIILFILPVLLIQVALHASHQLNSNQ